MKPLLPLLLCAAGCTAHAAPAGPPVPGSAPARYLYVWAGDTDEKHQDFLAVVDVQPGSATYAQVIATEPVGLTGSMPHHLEYELPGSDRLLFANAHHHEQILLFDTRQAERPRLARTLPPVAPLRYPHDFFRLPNGNVLVGYLRSEGPSPEPGDTTMPGGHGGIAELDPEGRPLRTSSAADPAWTVPIRPYAFAVLPQSDRVVTTSAGMMEHSSADVVQVWRLSDLALLHTLAVPPARRPDGGVLHNGHELPFEPRAMPDGSVLLNAFGCGLYHLTGIGTDAPRLRNVYTVEVTGVPADRRAGCGIPVVVGPYWVMPVGRMNMLVSLDVRDPARPVEVSRLVADTLFRPHWLAKDPGSDRLIVGAETSGEERMLMARVDPATGHLSWDESFRSPDGSLGVSFRRERWPHGDTGEAFGHAALFRP
jgi:hypothetical protein